MWRSISRRLLIVKYTSLGHNCVPTVFCSNFGCQVYRITEATRIHHLVVPKEPDIALCKESISMLRCPSPSVIYDCYDFFWRAPVVLALAFPHSRSCRPGTQTALVPVQVRKVDFRPAKLCRPKSRYLSRNLNPKIAFSSDGNHRRHGLHASGSTSDAEGKKDLARSAEAAEVPCLQRLSARMTLLPHATRMGCVTTLGGAGDWLW